MVNLLVFILRSGGAVVITKVGEKLYKMVFTRNPQTYLEYIKAHPTAPAAIVSLLVGKPSILIKPINVVKNGLVWLATDNGVPNKLMNATIVGDYVQHMDIEQCGVVLCAILTNKRVVVLQRIILMVGGFLILSNFRLTLNILWTMLRFLSNPINRAELSRRGGVDLDNAYNALIEFKRSYASGSLSRAETIKGADISRKLFALVEKALAASRTDEF